MKHPTLQPNQAQVVPPITRDLEGFDESRNTRGIDVGDIGQINQDGSCRCPWQHGEKLVTEGRRRVNAKTPPQAHDGFLVALFHRDLKIGGTNDAARQLIPPLLDAPGFVAI
jgi:hypothetical protein